MGKVSEILLENDLIGAAFFDDDYETAILGYTEDGCIVYSYEKMIKWFSQNYKVSYVEAREWVDYNALRTIPYMGEQKPIIVYDLIY